MPQIKPETIPLNQDLPTSRRVETPDIYYNMSHKHRGLALIFNHEHFDSPLYRTRPGTNKDSVRLQEVLTNLGFIVQIKKDLTFKDLFNSIQEVMKMDHSKNDCLLISVLTHGENGTLWAKDIHYSVTKLWCYLTDKYCPTLAGKPRIFIIQACRGNKYDDGFMVSSDYLETNEQNRMSESPTHHDSIKTFTTVPENNTWRNTLYGMCENPTHPDFIMAFATAPGYYAWRNSSNGSWFIQELCDILSDRAADTNILEIFTKVCQKVAFEYISYTPDEESSHEKKQTPHIHSTLTRLLVFGNANKKSKTDCCIAI